MVFSFGDRLKGYRTRAGLTTLQCADHMGWSRPTWEAMEADRRSPRAGEFTRIQVLLRLTDDEAAGLVAAAMQS